ncbi:MAG: hypothetical protein ABR986_09980 [Methanomassiliicoccales archaeon]|jgi:hypothetical protein
MEMVNIPDDLWDDWSWFITPHELRCTVVEDEKVVEQAKVAITAVYTLHLPKMVMNDVALASRLEKTNAGIVDTGIICRDVHLTPETLTHTITQLMLHCPLVVRKAEGASETPFSDVSDGLEVCFYNPLLIDDDKGSRDLFCMEPPIRCIEELSINATEGKLVMAVRAAVDELASRALIDVEEGAIVRITEKGKRLIETEPLNDRIICAYQMRPLE